jgi:hypothetical protein
MGAGEPLQATAVTECANQLLDGLSDLFRTLQGQIRLAVELIGALD